MVNLACLSALLGIDTSLGRHDARAQQLRTGWDEKAGGRNPNALKQLASLEEKLGERENAAATLQRINFIYPVDEELHRHLGDLWFAQGKYDGAVREYAAVVALHPVDTASAQFNVARAYFAG